jgi:hypothetical protein
VHHNLFNNRLPPTSNTDLEEVKEEHTEPDVAAARSATTQGDGLPPANTDSRINLLPPAGTNSKAT